jgi:hypothetical protein
MPLCDLLPFLDVYPVQVKVHAQDASSVVDHDRQPCEKMIPCQNHLPAVDRLYGRPSFALQVYARMGRSGLIVDDAALAKGPNHLAGNWPYK